MTQKNKRVCLAYGGRNFEKEVSFASAQNVFEAMKILGIEPFMIDLENDGFLRIIAINPSCVFICGHGDPGENGVLQGALSILGIPFTGSGVAASALAMDKPRTKQIWQSLDLPTAPMVVVNDVEQAEICLTRLGNELFVKPAREGSSIGTHATDGAKALRTALNNALNYDNHVLVEPYLSGSELTVGIIDGLALPVVEVLTTTGNYDYHAKYKSNKTQLKIPSSLGSSFEAKVQRLALDAFESLGCRSWGRVDLKLDKYGEPFLLEVNTVPGMTSHSLIPAAAKAAGMSFSSVVAQILNDAEVCK